MSQQVHVSFRVVDRASGPLRAAQLDVLFLSLTGKAPRRPRTATGGPSILSLGREAADPTRVRRRAV